MSTGSTIALRSNRHKCTFMINPQSQWRQDPRGSPWLVTPRAATPHKVGRLPLPHGRRAPPLRWCLLESSGVFLSWSFTYSLYENLICGLPFVLILITSTKIDNHQNLCNSISNNPMDSILILVIFMLCWWLKRVLIYCQLCAVSGSRPSD